MKLCRLILVLLALLTRTSFAAPFDISSISVVLPKSDEFIRAAVSLQAMGRDAACQALLASAKTNFLFNDRIFVLCRMLFSQHGTNEFRSPNEFPIVYFIGKKTDWPLAPIELVDGIPFLLAERAGGGDGGFLPESSESYLRYCMTNCDWNTYKFHEVTAKEKSDALSKLLILSSKKVKQPLSDYQKRMLSRQLE